MTEKILYFRRYGDRIAIVLSSFCAVHYLAAPLIVVLFPFMIALGLDDDSFHLWLLVVVVPVSVAALGLGCRDHGNKLVLGVGVLGVTLLSLAGILGHDFLGESAERTLTLIGSGLIAASHIRNFILCRTFAQSGCAH